MKTAVDLTDRIAETIAKQKAEAALKDLDQAWAYYMPEAKPADQEIQQPLGYVPYFRAA
ncbi:hypothetical protein RSK20926_04012 [Roseobacter sp. SK209-2-6]|uniref:hypothetical protein n=1 Tax=Roseobacter sp. SK209-2-6 TaxID=388739 RepID=UPI0000F3D2C1|nr:hypothetical protein [Roseobacter sp. SK209-2-6]EBA15016.1 hypothetical protein RSK20926_04012 [Roseobacter sp. SK209-2-6]